MNRRPSQRPEWSGFRASTSARGARAIYYFRSGQLPIFLLAAYGKNEKANLSQAERNAMAILVPMLVKGYPGRRGRKS